jgi:hypothetical protein
MAYSPFPAVKSSNWFWSWACSHAATCLPVSYVQGFKVVFLPCSRSVLVSLTILLTVVMMCFIVLLFPLFIGFRTFFCSETTRSFQTRGGDCHDQNGGRGITRDFLTLFLGQKILGIPPVCRPIAGAKRSHWQSGPKGADHKQITALFRAVSIILILYVKERYPYGPKPDSSGFGELRTPAALANSAWPVF